MEAIGRVRKVKSKIIDGVEKVVDKSKEKLENKKRDEANGHHEESDSDTTVMTNGNGASASHSDSTDHVKKISADVNLDKDQGRVSCTNAKK